MSNDAKYTRAEELALKATTYKVMTATLADFGWHHDAGEPSKSCVEVWKKQISETALLVFQPEATYSDIIFRQAESVSTFAKAEGLSRFEAIALLTGIVPWKSPKVRDRIVELSSQSVSGRFGL